MAALHNRVSQAELKKRLYEENELRLTISFYRYLPISDPKAFRDNLYRLFHELQVFGRIYVATEGINAQISVPEKNFNLFRDALYSVTGLDSIRLNVAVDHGKSFWVLKVKLRNLIVADGIDDPDFSMENKGKYVSPEQFNELTNDPNTIVVDMRNHYEFEVGHFENAIEIPSDTFRQQLPMAADMLKDKKNSNIIMYCTGGIRCEKASAYMLHNGFENVYHLEGGIINYANVIKEKNLPVKFHGKNFVFDDRLGERITDEVISHCHQCQKPSDTHINCVNQGCHLLFIQCEDCALKFNKCCSQACSDVVALPEEAQKTLRQGIDKGQMIFNKSRQRLHDHFNAGKDESK